MATQSIDSLHRGDYSYDELPSRKDAEEIAIAYRDAIEQNGDAEQFFRDYGWDQASLIAFLARYYTTEMAVKLLGKKIHLPECNTAKKYPTHTDPVIQELDQARREHTPVFPENISKKKWNISQDEHMRNAIATACCTPEMAGALKIGEAALQIRAGELQMKTITGFGKRFTAAIAYVLESGLLIEEDSIVRISNETKQIVDAMQNNFNRGSGAVLTTKTASHSLELVQVQKMLESNDAQLMTELTEKRPKSLPAWSKINTTIARIYAILSLSVQSAKNGDMRECNCRQILIGDEGYRAMESLEQFNIWQRIYGPEPKESVMHLNAFGTDVIQRAIKIRDKKISSKTKESTQEISEKKRASNCVPKLVKQIKAQMNGAKYGDIKRWTQDYLDENSYGSDDVSTIRIPSLLAYAQSRAEEADRGRKSIKALPQDDFNPSGY